MKEYKIVADSDSAYDLEEKINVLAREGWIVKSVLSETQDRYARIILERDAMDKPCA